MGLRVIAGEFRGRRLTVPQGLALRPTADRVKEAWFNILGGATSGARCLDLYAGTGALAIEALSRGAQKATLVESAREALAAIRANVARLGLTDRVEIIRADLGGGLKFLRPRRFELILADPPYGSGLARALVESVGRSGLLIPGGIMSVEHDSNEDMPGLLAGLRRVDSRRYGTTTLSFYSTETA